MSLRSLAGQLSVWGSSDKEADLFAEYSPPTVHYESSPVEGERGGWEGREGGGRGGREERGREGGGGEGERGREEEEGEREIELNVNNDIGIFIG